MKRIEWEHEKNERLKKERDIGFEEILTAMSEGGLIERRSHPNRKKYPTQFELVILIRNRDYVYVVPFVEDEEKIFFKTIFPSRVETKKYFNQR